MGLPKSCRDTFLDMKPPVEEVRISAHAKELLVKLKRRTGLTQWNYLCRIAYCCSIANPTPPPARVPEDVGIRMDWKTFAGPYFEEFACLNSLRASLDGINPQPRDAIADYFRDHLERGIEVLSGVQNLKDLANLPNR